MSKKKGIAKTLAAFATAGLLSCAMASAAFAAETYPISTQLPPGDTSIVVGGDGTKVDINVLDFGGDAGETVFLTAVVNGSPVAEYMPYVLGSDQAGADGQSADAFAIELDTESLKDPENLPEITVTVFADRADQTGTTYTVNWVYANLGDGKTALIGSCTDGATFTAPEKIQVDSTAYKLKGQSASDAYLYDYEAYDPATTVDGVIRYVKVNPGADEKAMLDYHTPIPGLKKGEERDVVIPETVVENGAIYSTLSFVTTVTAKYPADTSFTIPVIKMGESAGVESHAASIEMVDENGKVIAKDGVMVRNTVLYTAPSIIYKTKPVSEDDSEGETRVFAYTLVDDNPITLEPRDQDWTETVHYKEQPLDTAETEVTFRQVDGQERAKDDNKNRTLGSVKATVTGSDPEVTAEDINLETPEGYVLVGELKNYSYDLDSKKIPVVDVYYVPSDYQPVSDSYDVTVNYVNFFDRSVIDSETFESKASDVLDMKFTAPAQFSKDGVNWVRLGGQEDPILHNYYSQNKTYTVYYRDANQTLESAPIITQVRTLYEEQQVTATAGAAAGANAATTAATLNEGANYNVPTGQGVNPTATAQDGRTAVQERIEDDAVALSDGRDGDASATQAAQNMPDWAIPLIGVLGVAAVAGVIAFFGSRRRNDKDKA